MPRMGRPALRTRRQPIEVLARSEEDGAPSMLHAAVARPSGAERVRAWFRTRGWTPYPFQLDAWMAYSAGESGLVHVPTGAGKTYAAYGGPLAELLDDPGEGLKILYITPLRAVSRDIEKALKLPITELAVKARVESRTGDTSSSLRTKQRRELPQVLITTPESLSLLLTQEDARDRFAGVRCVIVDEWHELLTSKRGVQVELALARLRKWAPAMRTWALSATVKDVEHAARAAAGAHGPAPRIVSASLDRPVIIDSLIPANVDAFPWTGHLGLSMLKPLVEWLDPAHSTLIFLNTRSQAERWFQELLAARPEWAELMALHHGSIDRDVREKVEAGMKEGWLRFTVCTSSLDLGVDFSPVERVVQIGSPKGIARLIQRAGRASHRPGVPCRVLCVPTHAIELIEIAAARDAVQRGEIEERPGLSKPLDVLVQHLVTCALGGGFTEQELLEEVRTTSAYQHLTEEEFGWCMTLVRYGGETLKAYADFKRVVESEGRYVSPGGRLAQMHRLNVGTITSDSTVTIRYRAGKTIGSIEEYFVSRLHHGDVFIFGGKMLEFIGMHEMTALVKPARKRATVTPRWNGARFPLSTALSAAVRRLLEFVREGTDRATHPDVAAAAPVIDMQRRMSIIPSAQELLIELCESRDGSHLFLFPFDGRLVHEGLAALVAWRLGKVRRATFGLSINDYGIEISCQGRFPFQDALEPNLFSTDGLIDDVIQGVNVGELAKRQFREIARVAGLVMQRYPGAAKSGRQLQAGASLLYEVFEQFDPQNLLLLQARREVLERQFEQSRLARTLTRLRASEWRVIPTRRFSPLAFPLVYDRLGSTMLSTESILERMAKMTAA